MRSHAPLILLLTLSTTGVPDYLQVFGLNNSDKLQFYRFSNDFLAAALNYSEVYDDKKCDPGYFLNANKSCIPYITEYGGKCTENSQCEWLGANAICKFVCACQKGYRWYTGKCIKSVDLNGQCNDSSDCYDGYNPLALSCNSGKCACNAGYYQRGDVDCRKIASNVDDNCALDIDCKFDNNQKGQCQVGKCRATSIKAQLIDRPPNFLFSSSELPVEVTAAQRCSKSSDCEKIKNSECYDKSKTCVCKRGYFFDEQKNNCLPEIGMNIKCEVDKDCPIRPGKCIDGSCYCRDYYFVEDGNRNCVKTMSERNTNCLSNEWCYAWGPLSYCSSKGTCHCSKVSNFNNVTRTCTSNGHNDPTLCKSNLECMSIKKNSVCRDEKCECDTNYRQENDKCLPNIGAQCDKTESICTIGNSVCSETAGVCECTKDFVASGNKCFPTRMNLGDNCEVNRQCDTKIPYTKCSNGVCECLDNFLSRNNTCIRRRIYMDYCEKLLDCTLSLNESFQCRNSKCQCPTNSKYLAEKNYCSSSYIIRGSFILLTIVLLLNTVSF